MPPRKSTRNEKKTVEKAEKVPEHSEKVDAVQEPKTQKKVKKQSPTHNLEGLQDIAHKLRIHSIQMTTASKSGHPTSCASMADFLSVLFFDPSGMHYQPLNPQDFSSDRLVLSKGHAAPILYAAWAEAGLIPKEQLLNLRKIDCDLEGHPTPKLKFVDVATGSLGQGLGAACGMAYAAKYLDKQNNRFWCILGDGECAEGSVWEAAHFAGIYKLDNLTAIVDCNRLGQSQSTSLEHKTDVYKKRFDSFGWNSIVIDGHNLDAIIKSFEKSRSQKDVPTMIIAKTYKGKYIPEIEDQLNWHGVAMNDKTEKIVEHLNSLIKSQDVKGESTKPQEAESSYPETVQFKNEDLHYSKDKQVSTRQAYGNALARLGNNDPTGRVVALDGDTKNSTFSIEFVKVHKDRFIECFIAEQNIVSVAVGLQARGKVPFCSTFAAFFSRAFDQIRMAGVSQSNLKLAGSHCGVSIGEDGPSQMALEDLAMMRSIPNSVVFYPSDAVSTERAVVLAANHKGIVFIRTSRPNTDILYENNETFEIGKSKIVKQHENDVILLVGGGVTLHECHKASKILESQGVHARVMDVFSVKPFDKELFIKNAQQSNNLVLVVEDHYREGGLFETAASSIATEEHTIKIHSIAVDRVPRSGKPDELLKIYNLHHENIVEQVQKLIQ